MAQTPGDECECGLQDSYVPQVTGVVGLVGLSWKIYLDLC